MNKYLLGLFVFIASTTAMGATAPQVIPNDQLQIGKTSAGDKTIILNNAAGAANPKIKWNNTDGKIQFSNDGTNFKNIGSGSGGGGISLIQDFNPDFEAGVTNWTPSAGTLSSTSVSAEVGLGLKAGKFIASASSQTVSSSAVSIPTGLQNKPCVGSFWYSTTEATNKYKVQVYDGTNVLAETTLEATTGYDKSNGYAAFSCPSSGTVLLRIISTGSAAAIYFDQAFLGEQTTFQVSQATYYGSIKHAATTNCDWTSSAATFTAFPADADCPTPTVTGNVTAPATKIPGFVVSAPGEYLVVVEGAFLNTSSASSGYTTLKLSDGVINSSVAISPIVQASSYSLNGHSMGTYQFTKSDSAASTFNIYEDTDNATLTLTNSRTSLDGAGLTFLVYRFPTSSEVVVRAETQNSWGSTYWPDGTASFNFTSGSYVSVTGASMLGTAVRTGKASVCADTDSICLKIPSLAAGSYKVQYNGNTGGDGSAGCSLGVYDGTTDYEMGHGGNFMGNGHTVIVYSAAQTNKEFTLRVKRTVGAGNCRVDTAYNVGHNLTITPLDQQLPNPVFIGVRDQVTVHSGNGVGATNTQVRRFTNTGYTEGVCVSYSDSAANGASFTALCPGTYSISYGDGQTGADCLMGITLNSTALTTTPSAITYAQGLRSYSYARNGENQMISWTGVLNTGDIIRAQGACTLTGPMSNFTMTRVN